MVRECCRITGYCARVSDDLHIHVHLAVEASDSGQPDPIQQLILDRLTMMEFLMSDTSAALAGLTDAIAAATGRVNDDTAHLRDLLEQALATDSADQAEIDRLRGEASTVVDSINAATAQLSSIDPVADFPANTPAGTTPAGTTPGEPQPTDSQGNPIQPPADAGTNPGTTPDAGTPGTDIGAPDAGTPDAGTNTPDTGTTPDTGATPPSDVTPPAQDPADTATSSGL